MRFQKVAKLLNEAGWNLHRQSNGTHQRWINVKTGITTTISTSKGKLENYQLENLEKQFGVQLRGK